MVISSCKAKYDYKLVINIIISELTKNTVTSILTVLYYY